MCYHNASYGVLSENKAHIGSMPVTIRCTLRTGWEIASDNNTGQFFIPYEHPDETARAARHRAQGDIVVPKPIRIDNP